MRYYADSKWKNFLFVSTLFAPSVAILLIVVAYPLLRSFVLSLTSYNIISPTSHKFIGLKNYVTLWSDDIFWEALKNTLIFNVSSVLGGFLLGFLLALLLNANVRFRRIFRGILLAPWVIPYVVIGFLFLYMFNTKSGSSTIRCSRSGPFPNFCPGWRNRRWQWRR